MDRFHNKYGTMNSEGTDIISELETAIEPVLKKYENDIEALIFMHRAISFLFACVSEKILMYAFKLRKEEK